MGSIADRVIRHFLMNEDNFSMGGSLILSRWISDILPSASVSTSFNEKQGRLTLMGEERSIILREKDTFLEILRSPYDHVPFSKVDILLFVIGVENMDIINDLGHVIKNHRSRAEITLAIVILPSSLRLKSHIPGKKKQNFIEQVLGLVDGVTVIHEDQVRNTITQTCILENMDASTFRVLHHLLLESIEGIFWTCNPSSFVNLSPRADVFPLFMENDYFLSSSLTMDYQAQPVEDQLSRHVGMLFLLIGKHSFENCRKSVISIRGDERLSLRAAKDAIEKLSSFLPPHHDLIWAVGIDEEMPPHHLQLHFLLGSD